MQRRTLTVLAVAAIAILALSLAAATLTSTLGSEGEEADDQQPGGESEFGTNQTDRDRYDGPGLPELPTIVERLLTVIFVAGAVASVAYMISSPRKTVAVVAVLAVAVAFLWLFNQAFGAAPGFEEVGDFLAPGEEGEGQAEGSSEGQSDLSSPLVATLAVVLAVLFLGVALLLRRGDDDTDETDEDDERADEPESEGDDTAAIGAIASRAADRIETEEEIGGGAENEVYRAWMEMTAQLELDDPDTTTPREFQHHATTAGMTTDDVRELTRLFERVRYGGESATEDREQRAVSVLRRIESTYGDVE